MSSDNATCPEPVLRTPQRQRGRDRVAGLMAAAASLFVEKGYDAATMTEIAARAGASIGSLYLFFPTKLALAQAMVMQLADHLSARLDSLQDRAKGRTAAAVADALLEELAGFLTAHPVYGVLIDLPGDDTWKQSVRTRRRNQIVALFEQSCPRLPGGQPERLAVIMPQLMRMVMALSGDATPPREAVMQELRAMLRHHLEWPVRRQSTDEPA